jgi:hypothetical protein
MSDQTPSTLLSAEQLAALTDEQKAIFEQLKPKDQRFFAKNFTPEDLGPALDRKGERLKERARQTAHDERVKARIQADAGLTPTQPGLSAGEVAAGAAGVAGVVGLGVVASQIAPDGKAAWRGVAPRDLVTPLVSTFARQAKTDIRFDPPDSAGVIHADVLLRTSEGLLPALDITLAPLEGGTQVKIGKVSSESVLQKVKEGGQKLVGLVQDGLTARRGLGGLVTLAGKVLRDGSDLAQTVKDLDLEDKAWEAVKRAADPLQAVYDEKMAVENEKRLQLETAWDDYYACPKCRVEFGAQDAECRVCGTARPPQPEQADPRRPQ